MIALLLFVVTSTHAESQVWDKIQVTDRSDGSIGVHSSPSLLFGADRTIQIFFTRSQPSEEESILSTIPVTFSAVEYLSGMLGSVSNLFSGRGSATTSITSDSSGHSFALAAVDVSSSGASCFVGAMNDGSSDWQLDGDAGPCSLNAPVVESSPDGTLHVVYQAGGKVFYERRLPGSSWGTPIDLSVSRISDGLPTLSVGPDGRVHVVYVRHLSDSRDALIYREITEGVASSETTLRTYPGGLSVDSSFLYSTVYAPSIATDRFNTTHVAVTTPFGQDPAESHVLYLNNIGGNWSEPVPVTNIGEYNRVGLAAANDGTIHLAVEKYVDNWEIFYTERRAGAWTPEVNLTSNGVNDAVAPTGGHFIQVRDSSIAIVYTTFEKIEPSRPSPDDASEIALLLFERLPAATITLNVDTIDFGRVRIDSCADTMIVALNTGDDSLQVTGVNIIGTNSPFRYRDQSAAQLGPRDRDTLRLSFCPDRDGPAGGIVRIVTTAGIREVYLRGTGYRGASLQISHDTLDFGERSIGGCYDTLLILTNSGASPLEGQFVSFTSGQNGFRVSPSFSPGIPAGGSDTLTLSFCPDSTGEFVATVTIAPGPSVRRVVLKGRGRPETEPVHFWLDTVAGNVGDTIQLHLLTDNPTYVSRLPVGLRLDISFDQNALYIHSTSSSDWQIHPSEPGKAELTLISPMTTVDTLLATLLIEGFVTGKPENPIRIETVEVPGIDIMSQASFSRGLVYLSGCDITRGLSFEIAPKILSLTPNPGGEEVELTWSGTLDIIPDVNIYDLSGRLIQTIEIDQKDRTIQEVRTGPAYVRSTRLNLSEIKTGIYFVRLGKNSNEEAHQLRIDR